MQEEMVSIDKEQGEPEARARELEKQLRIKTMIGKQRENIREMMDRVNIGLENLDFKSR